MTPYAIFREFQSYVKKYAISSSSSSTSSSFSPSSSSWNNYSFNISYKLYPILDSMNAFKKSLF